MLDCELIPVTLGNLDIASKLTAEFDFPRSENWIRRALFNPHVAPCGKSARRGYMLKSKDDGYVGILCYSPMKLYLRDKPLIGYSGLLLGVRKKYGEWLMDLFKAVQEDEAGHLAFGNTSCSAHATRICRMARGDKLGPGECGFVRIAYLGVPSCMLALFRRIHAAQFQGALWWLLAPIRIIEWGLNRLAFRSKFQITQTSSFDRLGLGEFWKRYRLSNGGLVSSREPEILEHLFSDALKAGKLVLMVARNDSGIVGYILLRKYTMFGFDGILKYKIIDAIALQNDVGCLRDLVRAAKLYARKHSGERVEYIGGNPHLADWIDCELKRHINFGFNTTTYFYNGNDNDLVDAVENRKGWFFGPFDGERCLGHAGYVDL